MPFAGIPEEALTALRDPTRWPSDWRRRSMLLMPMPLPSCA
ncbi:MAG: hypothetical protein O3A20_08955 [Planctomycetota bacterium]|nr:hypothetical protein [Planctomycetota bacterium]